MRIALLTLKNLMATGDEAVMAEMLDAGLARLINIRSAQSWADEDIPPVLEAMAEGLQSSLVQLNSFEKYKGEVLSGNLDWSPMHSQRAFWQVSALPRAHVRHCSGDSRGVHVSPHGRVCRRTAPSWRTRTFSCCAC